MNEIIDMEAPPRKRAIDLCGWLLKKTRDGAMKWEERHAKKSRPEYPEGQLPWLETTFSGVIPTKSESIVWLSGTVRSCGYHSSTIPVITMGGRAYQLHIAEIRFSLSNREGERLEGGSRSDDWVFSPRDVAPASLYREVMEKYGVHHPASEISGADALYAEINRGEASDD